MREGSTPIENAVGETTSCFLRRFIIHSYESWKGFSLVKEVMSSSRIIPPRTNTSPPKGGGFRDYPKKRRTLPSLDGTGPVNGFATVSVFGEGPGGGGSIATGGSLHRASHLPSTAMVVDLRQNNISTKQFSVSSKALANQPPSLIKNFDPAVDHTVNQMKKVSIDVLKEAGGDKKGAYIPEGELAPHLVSSYSNIWNKAPTYSDGTERVKDKGFQGGVGDGPPMLKQEFPDYKDYQTWMQQRVDPFVKKLRKTIIANKPENIEEYVMAFCLSELRGVKAPETVLLANFPRTPPKPEQNSNVPILGKGAKKGGKKKKEDVTTGTEGGADTAGNQEQPDVVQPEEEDEDYDEND